MSGSTTPSLFTTLTQPADTVTQSTPASPFDAATAYLLGQCCNLAYDQFQQGDGWAPDWSSLIVAGSTVSLAATTAPANPKKLTIAEAIGPEPIAGDPGFYLRLPAGFAVQLTLTPSTGAAQTIVVICLRGTRTWQEWVNDAEALPAVFPHGGNSDGLGSVHAGFFADYAVGTNGATSTTPLSTSGQRAPGSLAAQIADYVSQLDGTLPLYVTGHSLGGALAALCALDVAANYPKAFSSLAMYSLASPRLAVGFDIAGISAAFNSYGNQEAFVQAYQQNVPNTYAIVNAADAIPVLPPLSTSPTAAFTLACAQVTDQWGGVGATATAQLDSTGGVASIAIGGPASGYVTSNPPNVVISGGGGSGAAATASVDSFGTITVTVTAAGSGYTAPAAVAIVSTGSSLLANVISFCAQTGDVLGNHSCDAIYVPYLAQLAVGLGGS